MRFSELYFIESEPEAAAELQSEIEERGKNERQSSPAMSTSSCRASFKA